jgi:putative membrane protein
VALRVLSIAVALLQYYGFVLTEHGRRLTVERGLLARLRTSAARNRIQAWTLHEGVLHRWFRRRSLRVDSAVGEQQGQQERALRELAPIATPDACDALVRHLLPEDAQWGALDWRPLHPRAWRRLALPGSLFALAATAALCWRFGGWGLAMLAWVPWSAFAARQHARRAAYALNHRLVAVREGWWTRHWRFAELDKLQALRLSQSPFDRRHGMATLWLDTAGAGVSAPPLRIRFLPEAQARALFAHLARTIARRRLRW